MKVLVLRTERIMREEEKIAELSKFVSQMHMGVVIVDGRYDPAVVEIDGLTIDQIEKLNKEKDGPDLHFPTISGGDMLY